MHTAGPGALVDYLVGVRPEEHKFNRGERAALGYRVQPRWTRLHHKVCSLAIFGCYLRLTPRFRNFSYEDVHIEGTQRIAEAVAKYDVDRFIHVSSYNADVNSPSKFFATKVGTSISSRHQQF